MLPDKNKANEVLTDLKHRFLDGDKLTVKEVVEEYFNAKNPYTYLVLEKRIRSWMSAVKHWFRTEHGLWFGNLDDEGRYGLITSKEEARYTLIRYYRFVKGVVSNATLLAEEAEGKGFLPSGFQTENLLVAKLEEEEENGD